MFKLHSILLIFTIFQSINSFTTNTRIISALQKSRFHTRKDMSLAATVSTSTASPPALKVAVIGAGAAGLVTARILQRNGIKPTILEKDSQIGGVWSYQPNSKSRPVYRGLRTNLPRELMAYREFPWGGDGKTMSFVTHADVKDYLCRYAKAMEVEDLIQYRSTVTQLEIIKDEEKKSEELENPSWPQIKLEWDSDNYNGKTTYSEIFDAVCICNGHYAAPANPIIPGIEAFQGKVYHSIEYDDPAIFQGKNVLCIGGRASGSDLAREISHHATRVYLSDTTCPDLTEGEPITEGNVSWVPRTTAVLPNSRISFGSTCNDTPQVDVIIFCSGYDYQFPFINERSNLDDFSVVTGERRVKPLYEQLWHARYPSLTFVGLQHSVVPFPFFELQAEAIVSQLVRDSSSSSSSTTTTSAWNIPPQPERNEGALKD
jgi:thioredoxin reductase